MPNLLIDRLSFWLGFLAASLFWWLLGRIRPLIPQWRDLIKKYLARMRQKSLSRIEEYLRQDTIRRAQRQHLAATLFPLDDLLVQPRLLAPPSYHKPAADDSPLSAAAQVIPYLPDWPELVTPLGAPTILPIEAVDSRRNLAIIGQPGSGKTVTLAHLACQLARDASDPSTESVPVPLFIHVLDLDTSLKENVDVEQSLLKRIIAQSSVIMQPQMMRYLTAVFREKSRRPILLVDGLDELPPEQMTAASAYLVALRKQLPRLQIVVAAAPEFLDGLTQAGFYPLSVAGWGVAERDQLVSKWARAWNTQLLPDVRKQFDAKEISETLYNHWLGGDPAYASPLEWTLRLWGGFAGDLSGSFALGIIDNYLSRYLPDPALIPAMEEMAHAMLLSSSPSMSFNQLDKILSAYKPASPAIAAETPGAETQTTDSAAPPAEGEQKPRKKVRRDITAASQGEGIITALVNGGVLVEHSGGQVRFASPVLLGFLAGPRLSEEEAAEVSKGLNWPAALCALQYHLACSDQANWIYPLFDDPVPPLFQRTLTAARWLRDAPPNAEWRGFMMRALVALVQSDYLPVSARARAIGAFVLSRDPSITRLFKQLLTARSPVIRRLALMGCGASASPQLVSDIASALEDPVAEVRLAACLALNAIPGEAALKMLVNTLLNGSEETRHAAAEGLALKDQGLQLLAEAAVVDDLLTRRAAVSGLLQLRDPMARQILEKIAVEDGQWVVRNAAALALERLQNAVQVVPKPLPQPSESPWLLTFASKLGMGIQPGQPATDVLIQALKTGSPEEQASALLYLREQPSDGIAREIYNIIYSESSQIHEPAMNALWWMSAGGAELPAPQAFGLG